MVISKSKITSKRQITLPIKVMERLKLHPGDDIVFEEHKGHIEIKNAPKKFTIHDFVKKYKGIIRVKQTDGQIRQAIDYAWTEAARETCEKMKKQNEDSH